MAKVIIVTQRHPSGKMLQRGEFTQKKRFWEALTDAVGAPELEQYELYNDIDRSTVGANYSRLCKFLSSYGRAVLLDSEGTPQFMVVETNQNEWRDWDLDDSGEPVPNPVKKD